MSLLRTILLFLCLIVLLASWYYDYRYSSYLEEHIKAIEQRLDATDSGNGNVLDQNR